MVREPGEIYLKLFVPLLAEVLICAHMLWEDLRIHNVPSVLHLNFLPFFLHGFNKKLVQILYSSFLFPVTLQKALSE